MTLLRNSRFWILATGFVLAVNIAGVYQLTAPDPTVQLIRVEEAYGLTAVALLYAAILISPLYAVFPRLPFKAAVVHARRAIGVLAFFYGLLHAVLAFFGQLEGFAGLRHLNTVYAVSLAAGSIALIVLAALAATSFNAVVRRMGYAHWKLLHRLVYIGSAAVLLHMVLIGSHFLTAGVIGWSLYAAAGLIVVLEIIRIARRNRSRTARGEASI